MTGVTPGQAAYEALRAIVSAIDEVDTGTDAEVAEAAGSVRAIARRAIAAQQPKPAPEPWAGSGYPASAPGSVTPGQAAPWRAAWIAFVTTSDPDCDLSRLAKDDEVDPQWRAAWEAAVTAAIAAQQPQPAADPDGQQRYIDDLHDLIRDILQADGETTDLHEWRDRAGALHVCDPDGQPYRAWTEDEEDEMRAADARGPSPAWVTDSAAGVKP